MTAAGFEGHSNALLNQYRTRIAALEAEVARLRPVVEAAREMRLWGHSSHWDRTGGAGSGCPACQAEHEQYSKLRQTLGALDAAQKELGNG